MNRRQKTKMMGKLIAAGSLVLFATPALPAQATTYTIDFDNAAALAQVSYAPFTFISAPWYQVRAARNFTFTVQDNSGVGHYHLGFEDTCWDCLAPNGTSFGYDSHCVVPSHPPSPPGPCMNKDITTARRNVSPHMGTASILTSAQYFNEFNGTTSPAAFTVASVQLVSSGAPVLFCFGTTTQGVLCTGTVSQAGTYGFSIPPATWMEVHGTTNSEWTIDNIVVQF